MRLTMTLLAGCVLAPAPLLAQGTPRALLGSMSANVARITEPAEKERWRANVALWQISLAQPTELAKADIDRMTALLDRVKANVAQVTAADEKERWQANVDLWSATIAVKAVFFSGDAVKLKVPFKVMKANVAAIAEAGEKGRWSVNRDLWQVMVNRAVAAQVDPVIAPRER